MRAGRSRTPAPLQRVARLAEKRRTGAALVIVKDAAPEAQTDQEPVHRHLGVLDAGPRTPDPASRATSRFARPPARPRRASSSGAGPGRPWPARPGPPARGRAGALRERRNRRLAPDHATPPARGGPGLTPSSPRTMASRMPLVLFQNAAIMRTCNGEASQHNGRLLGHPNPGSRHIVARGLARDTAAWNPALSSGAATHHRVAAPRPSPQKGRSGDRGRFASGAGALA